MAKSNRIFFDRQEDLDSFIKDLGISRNEFADIIGLSYRDLYNLLNNKTNTIKSTVMSKIESMGFKYYPSKEYKLKKQLEFILYKYNIDMKKLSNFVEKRESYILDSINPAKKPFSQEYYQNMFDNIKEYVINEIEGLYD